MLSIFFAVAVVGLAVSSVTRHRILIICGFYSFYALLTVMDEGNVPHLGPITIYRGLYLVLLISLITRFVQDRNFLVQMRRLPLLPYASLLVFILASSLYAHSRDVFLFDSPGGVWPRITVLGLFLISAAHVQEEVDLKLIAGTSSAVSFAVAIWVIWHAAQLSFEAYRGGIEVNQNYVSIFLFLGALPLVSYICIGKNRLLKSFCLPLLLFETFAALILASRGGFTAFAVAVVWMAVSSLRRHGFWRSWGLGLALVLGVGIALLLPGSGNFVQRFSEGDLTTMNERTLIWSRSWSYFTDSSVGRMIFGQGLSSAPVVIGPVLPADLVNYHNEYLRWLMDIGIVGLAAMLIFLYDVTRRVLQSNHSLRHLMVGWLVFLLLAGLTGTVSDLHVFWILLGAMVAPSSLASHARESRKLATVNSPRTPSVSPVSSTVEGL